MVKMVCDQDMFGMASNVYYIDSISGSDENSGISENEPWESLAKANETVFLPGDIIKLKSGCEWVGQFNPKGSGTEGNPITITAYGEGEKPHIKGDGTTDTAVLLFNQQYWEIDGIQVSNTANAVGDFRGIGIKGMDAGVLKHFTIKNCYIHDVTGEVVYFGLNDSFYEEGKKTGGVFFWTDTVDGTPTWFEDVLIENNEICYNSFNGIAFKQTNKEGWALRQGGAYDINWKPHRYITIRNNYFEQNNPDHQRVPILLTAVKGAVVEKNMLHSPIQCGIELNYADSVLVQFNEIYNSVIGNTGADSCAMDFDRACTNTVWQFNYANDCNVAFLTCHAIDHWDFGFGNVVRYNIFQNTQETMLLDVSRGGPDWFYDNIFYNDKYENLQLFRYGMEQYELLLTNNIFLNTKAEKTTDPILNGRTIDNNIYWGDGIASHPNDANARRIDPMFADPGRGGIGDKEGPAFESLGGYRITNSTISETCAADALAQMAGVYGDDTYYEKVAEYAASKGEKPAEVYIYGWDIYVHEPAETVEEALELISQNPQMLGHYVRYETLAEGNDIACFYNGELIDFMELGGDMPFVQNSITMVPLVALVKSFGATVEYDAENNTAVISYDGTVITVTENNVNAFVNDVAVVLDTAPVTIEGSFFVPLSCARECFNTDVRCVNYTDKAGVVAITDIIRVETNHAYSATVTQTSVHGMNPANPLAYINDGNGSSSATWKTPTDLEDPEAPETPDAESADFPIYVTFNWDTQVRVEKVVLTSGSSHGQAPTNFDVEISIDGTSDWITVASSGDIEWPDIGNTNQSHELTFSPASVKGVRLKFNTSNNMWGKMVIREVEIKG